MLDSISVVSKVGEVCVIVPWLSMVSADVLFFSVLEKLCLWTFKTSHTPKVTYFSTMNDAITDIFYCCYWEHPWRTHWEPKEHIGNLMGTHWELEGNKGKMKKRKRIKALSVHAEPSHWLHEISISKTVCHHFWSGLVPP
jgi:hypothetical protein